MGNILTTQEKTRLSCRQIVIVGGMSLVMNQNTFAAALFDHIIQPYVGTKLTYDSNVLRLPNDFTPEMSGNKTTTGSFIKQINAGFATSWQISQQQLITDVSINQNWFSTFNELNYTGYDVLGRWNWQLGQKLKGELRYNNRLTLGSFQSINGLVANNLQKTENYTVRGNYEIFPDWYLRAGFMSDNTRYPSTERRDNNLLENSKELGVRYVTPLDNVLGFYVTIIDGKYPLRSADSNLDNAYTRTNYILEGRWNYSVKTQIKGEIGYLSQDFQHIKSRNFSGITANGNILWEITRKSSVLLAAWREVSDAGALTSSFVMNQGVRLTPIWRWAENPRIEIEVPMSYEQRISVGSTGVANGATTPAQQAETSMVGFNINYIPRPNIEITAFMSYENRQSNRALNAYQDESVGLTMKVSF